MKDKWFLNTALAGCVSLGATIVSAPAALAQGDAADDDVIIVSAQRRDQSLEDVPISVNVFSGDRITRQRIEEIEDFVVLSPNVTFDTNGTRSTQDITIRGVSNIGGAANTYGVYIDEFNVSPGSNSVAINQAVLDLERIEVLRGPQGTFFGRNVTAGAINITTVKPGDEFGGNIQFEGGSFGTFIGRASVNLPLTDKLAVRVSGYAETTDGFLENDGPSDATNDQENFALRGAVRYTPTENITMDTSATYTEVDQGFPNFVPTGVPNDTFELIGFTLVPPSAGFFPDNTDTIATDQGLREVADNLTLTNRIAWEFDTFEVINVTGYINSFTNQTGERDYVNVDLYTIGEQSQELESWSTETRIQSTDNGSAFSWMIGGLYAQDNQKATFDQNFNSTNWGAFLGLPPFLLPVPEGVGFEDFFESEAESYAIFGDISWTGLQNDALILSFSARYAFDEISVESFREDFSPLPPYQFSVNGGLGAPSEFLTGTADFEEFLPRFAATYEITEDVSVYGVVSKGYKPGGFNLGAVGPTVNPGDVPLTFGEEKLWNYEAGFKGTAFDGALRFDIAGFYMDWNDIQVTTGFFDPVTLATAVFTVNYEGAVSAGVEANFAANITENFVIEGGVGYLDATFDDSDQLVVVRDDGTEGNISGNQLPGASNWTANIAGQYTTAITPDVDGFLRVEWIYQGERFSDIDNERLFRDLVPQYDTMNVRAGVDFENISIIAFGENLINADYTTGYLAQESLAGVFAVVNPRRWGVRASYNF